MREPVQVPRRHTDDLDSALPMIQLLEIAQATRLVIGPAQGVLMKRRGLPSDEPFDWLRRVSMNSNRKLRVVAGEVVNHHLARRTAS